MSFLRQACISIMLLSILLLVIIVRQVTGMKVCAGSVQLFFLKGIGCQDDGALNRYSLSLFGPLSRGPLTLRR
jgi:hypothetical protein